ncbi:MAG: hypothetical protein RBT36_09450 [Desulfobulbus sp.]|jgi:hypothetical protein|nr:hypothetical protein [Desulfobulbus sp.]
MPDMSAWVEHLHKPLVLMGFVLIVLAGLVQLFKPGELSHKARERLLNRIVLFAGGLGLLIVLAAVSLAWKEKRNITAPSSPSDSSSIHQNTTGTKSPAVSAKGDVTVQYDTAPLPQKESNTPAPSPSQATPPANVQQHTQGDQSPAINSGGNVNVQY